MTRYEGMDKLLRGVRERMQSERDGTAGAGSANPFTYSVPVQPETYDTVLGSLGVLVREAEHVREMISSQEVMGLTEEQRDHLLSVLGQIMEELWICEANLQGVK